ncbi:xanthine dehydrogenase family Fe-S subunit [Xanthobacter flavus]|uniref:xanthine dehydrogenase family Fe-S subunit n=1 Tax=Xanthobacter flavus TaxID=281 RepID=UPI001AE4FDBE|nr:2Fe-2S iron-sulfur cluster-binding protein [Xanthobacter flavus]MBP2149077.1 carbon-monoxide dehydrogenase small subunit [Xanthobacter flavus]
MNAITLTVNGQRLSRQVEPRTHLADFLREELNLTGTHLGCEQGVCGACTVLIDGKPQRSCIASAAACDGADIRTIEGFDGDALMGELREAFSVHHALQCGFCTPGMLISSRDIVSRLGETSERTVREELSGNLCRCTGYVGIVNAVCAVSAGKAPAWQAEAVGIAAAAAPAPVAAAAPKAAPAPAASIGAGGSEIRQSLTVDAAPEVVWPALKDIHLIARCLPGAEVTAFDGEKLEGRMVVTFGPIKAAFGGDATVTFDDAARTGLVVGSGRDGGSRAHGEITFALKPAGTGSAIDLALRYRISGPLAQFSRGALVQNLVSHLTGVFAANLAAALKGEAPTTQTSLSALGIVKVVLATWFKRMKTWVEPHPK